MDRLTERISDGILVKEDYGENVLKTLYQCYGAEPMPHYANCEEGYCAMEKLAEYEDLEEQGKLLKPKCLPGDYVWEINKERNIISEYEVSSIRYGINKTFCYMWTLRDGIYGDLDGFSDDEIGKTVFLTKEKAEAALKELLFKESERIGSSV